MEPILFSNQGASHRQTQPVAASGTRILLSDSQAMSRKAWRGVFSTAASAAVSGTAAAPGLAEKDRKSPLPSGRSPDQVPLPGDEVLQTLSASPLTIEQSSQAAKVFRPTPALAPTSSAGAARPSLCFALEPCLAPRAASEGGVDLAGPTSPFSSSRTASCSEGGGGRPASRSPWMAQSR